MSGSGLGAGVRIGWDDVGDPLREALRGWSGSDVVAVEPKVGGFSPGAAVGLRLADRRAYFLKAVSAEQNAQTCELFRAEVRVNGWLPQAPCVPALRWAYDDGTWVGLLFDHVDGATPPLPWRDEDLSLVVATMRDWHAIATPAPEAAPDAEAYFGDDFRGWRRMHEAGTAVPDPWAARHAAALAAYEEHWAAAAAGDTLVHADLRADNVLLAGGRAYFVDWPWAARAAGWFDVVGFAPSVVLQGGPPPGEIVARYADVPVELLVPVVAALAGMFVERSLQPAPPGLPTLRAYQAAQGEVAVRWLRELTGLP